MPQQCIAEAFFIVSLGFQLKLILFVDSDKSTIGIKFQIYIV